LLFFAGALMASACRGGGEAAPTTTPTSVAATSEQAVASRCTNVPQALVNTIGSRLTLHETLTNAQAVKSADRKRVWFISGEIDGPGLDRKGDIGTWAKVGPLAVDGGLILSIDSVFAQQLSAWPRGDATYAYVTMDDDGAQESHDCVKRR
jgi:hypothetical protein